MLENLEMKHSDASSARPQAFKNNGPWIAGIVGVLHIVPHYIIYAVWKTMAAHADKVDRHIEGPGAFDSILWNGCTLLMVVGLVLSLFGKSGKAKTAGLANLGVGVVLILLSLVGSHPVVAFSAGVVYVIAGLLSLRNAGLPDDNVTLA